MTSLHPGAEEARATSGGVAPRRNRRLGVLIALPLALGFAGGIAGWAVADHGDTATSSRAGRVLLAPSNDKSATSGAAQLSPHQIYLQDAPGVVHITAQVTVQNNSVFGFPQAQQGEQTGSGVVLDDRGHIVTNAHVVDGATAVSVSFSDSQKVDAKVIGTDVSTDLAVLSVDASDQKIKNGLKPLPLGDSSKVQVGDPVVAIGNPFNLDRTMTAGIVSALQRQIQAQNNFTIDDVIQTDAAINPGNSGGPLINMRGEVIGINSQIQSQSGGNVGIGFAVPSNTIDRVSTQLIDKGSVKHAWLGVVGSDLDTTLGAVFKKLGAPLPVDKGVLVSDVTKGSPADKAGLKGGDTQVVVNGQTYSLGGDIVVKFGNDTITTMRQLAELVNKHQPGDSIKIEYYRGGKHQTATVTLGDRPAKAPATTTQSGQ